MKIASLSFALSLLTGVFSSAALATEYHSGDVSGVWTKANSPHVIVAEVRGPPGQSLTIMYTSVPTREWE